MRRLLAPLAPLAALAAAACFALPTHAFFIGPVSMTVVEYHNVDSNHYFLTANAAEMRNIDAGSAGPGWVRTGRAFETLTNPYHWGSLRVPVARFIGTPGLGPHSHFFTENRDEALALQRPGSGWTLEDPSSFVVALPVAGVCPADAPAPIYRLYNNRWMFNDSNHRYVAHESDRAEMIAAGWLDEGVHFCVHRPANVAVKAFRIEVPLAGNVLPSAQCEDEALRVGGCIAVNQLPVPERAYVPPTIEERYAFAGLTSIYTDEVYVPAALDSPPIQDSFVQASSGQYGLHIDTKGKPVPSLSSINPLYQFRTQAADGAARFFPWRDNFAHPTELSIWWSMDVRRVLARSPASHLYGHPTLEFVDTRSGRHLYFTLLAYGTVEGGEYLSADVAGGKVIVGTTARDRSPYGRNVGQAWAPTPRDFDARRTFDPSMYGVFDFRMHREEFQRVLAAARTVDPALSADPADYLLDNFHFNNAVYGDGELGLNLQVELRVMRR